MGFFSKLSALARTGLILGVIVIVALVVGFGYWALRAQYVPVASQLSPDKTAAAAKALDALKIPYRIIEDGTAIEVIQKDAGKARSELAATTVGFGSNQGFELFNNTDFSATDFSQRVNFQRALQGELTRTIQSIEGVTTARVHLVLPEGNGLRRRGAKATAAVAIALEPGKTLNPTQVKGIQRLVASAIPEIKIEDVAVIDFSGTPLSRASGDDSGMSSAQLELKRDADMYFEAKVNRLLREALPGSTATVSVDVALNFDQIKVTTERALPSREGSPDSERDVGVVIKERQVQRTEPGNGKDGAAAGTEVLNLEFDYKVGHRIEQSLQSPGGIKRMSIAVVVHGQPAQISADELTELVSHAVGIVRTRGDAVSVVVLPSAREASDTSENEPQLTFSEPPARSTASRPVQAQTIAPDLLPWLSLAAAIIAVLATALLLGWLFNKRQRAGGGSREVIHSDEELKRLTEQVRVWLREGARHAG